MHIPKRMCVSCRQMKPKSELIRIVNSPSGVVIAEGGGVSGRGAYVCKDPKCIENAKKRKSFSRHFKKQVDDGIYSEISEALGHE